MRNITKEEVVKLMKYDQEQQRLNKEIAAEMAGTAQFLSDMSDDGTDNLEMFIKGKASIDEVRDGLKNEIEQLARVVENKHKLLHNIDRHLALKKNIEGMHILEKDD